MGSRGTWIAVGADILDLIILGSGYGRPDGEGWRGLRESTKSRRENINAAGELAQGVCIECDGPR